MLFYQKHSSLYLRPVFAYLPHGFLKAAREAREAREAQKVCDAKEGKNSLNQH